MLRVITDTSTGFGLAAWASPAGARVRVSVSAHAKARRVQSVMTVQTVVTTRSCARRALAPPASAHAHPDRGARVARLRGACLVAARTELEDRAAAGGGGLRALPLDLDGRALHRVTGIGHLEEHLAGALLAGAE